MPTSKPQINHRVIHFSLMLRVKDSSLFAVDWSYHDSIVTVMLEQFAARLKKSSTESGWLKKHARIDVSGVSKYIKDSNIPELLIAHTPEKSGAWEKKV
jgi:hypothetical protein